MPSSRQARITRTAISPRLAIRIFLNMRRYASGQRSAQFTIVIHLGSATRAAQSSGAPAGCREVPPPTQAGRAAAGSAPQTKTPLPHLRKGRCPEEGGKPLLRLAGRLFHDAARVLRRLGRLGFLGGHGFIG